MSVSIRVPLVAALALALAACCHHGRHSSAPASDASEEEREVAQRRWSEGQRAFMAGRYKQAIESFLQGDRIVGDATFPYNIALAYESLGDVPRATWWLREYLRRDPGAEDRVEVEATIASYQRRLEKSGVHQVSVSSSPPGAVVLIDGQPVGHTPWAGQVSPGTHILDLEHIGHERARRAFELDRERAADLHVELRPMR